MTVQYWYPTTAQDRTTLVRLADFSVVVPVFTMAEVERKESRSHNNSKNLCCAEEAKCTQGDLL